MELKIAGRRVKQREKAEALSPGQRKEKSSSLQQHALKGQKLLAQGNALGIKVVSKAPCKGKSFKIHLMKLEIPLRYVKLLPLQGAWLIGITTQGVALG